jgi:hypothetical protein
MPTGTQMEQAAAAAAHIDQQGFNASTTPWSHCCYQPVARMLLGICMSGCIPELYMQAGHCWIL